MHALTDVIGRPYALMLTAGNVSNVKPAPTLPERAGRCVTSLLTKATMPTGCAARRVTPEPFLSHRLHKRAASLVRIGYRVDRDGPVGMVVAVRPAS